MDRIYIAIDLKSFYASVECMERGLNPLTTNLVVADDSRTEKTICLAVSPSLKSFGVPGRPRLFEVIQIVSRINAKRQIKAPNRRLEGKSYLLEELNKNPKLAVDYIVAKPRMAYYIEYSTRIYDVYLKYVAPEDIHVYSIDEVFLDVTNYLAKFNNNPHVMAMTILKDVIKTTGITATAGIGTNMYLAKIAMDIVAKRMPADKDGVRIAELDMKKYRKLLWAHQPITDFWRVGKGYARRLREYGMTTMGDVARMSLENEDLLYSLFGVNAEILIDHAWGYEPTTIADIKAYKPKTNSLGAGQVLSQPYSYEKARLITWEMIDQLVLELVDKGLVTKQVGLNIDYDVENLNRSDIKANYKGEVTRDIYGRLKPKSSHGSKNLDFYTSSTKLLVEAMMDLYDSLADENLLVRKISIRANDVIFEKDIPKSQLNVQLDMFSDHDPEDLDRDLEKEKKLQKMMIDIKKKYGKNAIMKGANLKEGATARKRNRQIGGHRA